MTFCRTKGAPLAEGAGISNVSDPVALAALRHVHLFIDAEGLTSYVYGGVWFWAGKNSEEGLNGHINLEDVGIGVLGFINFVVGDGLDVSIVPPSTVAQDEFSLQCLVIERGVYEKGFKDSGWNVSRADRI